MAQEQYDTVIEAFTPRNFPPDLTACYLWLAATLLCIVLPVVNGSFIRIVFGLPFILFLPGYALIAALFPGNNDIDDLERIALSFGLSLAISPLAGLALNYTPWGIRLDPVLAILTVITGTLCIAAQYRRAKLAPENRYRVPADRIRAALSEEFFSKNASRLDRALSLILLAAIVAAVATTVYVIAVPKEGEKFTEFFILGNDRKAADYPQTLITGKNSSLFIGIGNHEYRTVTYTVETYLINMEFDDTTNTSRLLAMDRTWTFPVTLAHNETQVLPYTFMPDRTGYNRIEFLLFNETVPDDLVTGMDRINRSYRNLHLWVRIRSQ